MKSCKLLAISCKPESRQSSPRPASRTPLPASRGFTLMELMVSVAILLALLAMVGTIFSTASKAGGQAQALSTVYRQLASAAESIRRDLANMDPANDTLGIAGVIVQAKNKSDDPPVPPAPFHRADLLMLFTQRGDARPYVYRNFADPTNDFNLRSVVVYGHADVGHYDSTIIPPMTTVQTIEQVTPPPTLPQIPAYNWHLSRRAMFIPNTLLTPNVTMGVWNYTYSQSDSTFVGLTSPYFLGGLVDTLSGADLWPVSWLLGTSNLIGEVGGYFRYNENQALLYAFFPIAGGAYRYDPSAPAKSGVDCRWLYYEAGTKKWYAYNPGAAPGLRWVRTEGGVDISSPVQPPPPTSLLGANRLLTRYQTTSATNRMSLGRLLFYNNDDTSTPVNRRTVIDPSPPTGTSGLLANQFLPNCTDFRVEYTYDDPREVTLGFADPLNGTNPIPPNSDFIRPINWQQVVNGQQVIWSRLSTLPANDRTDPHRWPRAIRITLKAVDAGGRLADPVTYSIVHCWQ